MRAPLLPSARSIDDDRGCGALRKDNKITAILHTGYPIRYWDNDLGPGSPHLLALDLADGAAPVDLTPQPGRSAAGRRLRRQRRRPLRGDVLAACPRPARPSTRCWCGSTSTSGDRTVIADEPDADLWSPAISPDGSAVAFIRESYSTPLKAPRITLCYLRFGERADRSRGGLGPLAGVGDVVARRTDGRALIVTADDGRPLPGVPDRNPRRRR